MDSLTVKVSCTSNKLWTQTSPEYALDSSELKILRVNKPIKHRGRKTALGELNRRGSNNSNLRDANSMGNGDPRQKHLKFLVDPVSVSAKPSNQTICQALLLPDVTQFLAP